MGENSKREYFRMIYARYRLADPEEKSRILDEFCKVCGYNRKKDDNAHIEQKNWTHVRKLFG